MRWQKPARLAIAAFVIAFAAVVVVALRRSGPPKAAPTTPRIDPQTIAETHAAAGAPLPVITRTGPDGKVSLTLAFEKQLTYPDGRNVFTRATITLPDNGGRSVTITGAEAELLAPQDSSQELASARMSGGVTLKTSDGLEVTADTASYDDKTGVVTVPGEVHFTRGRLSGSGIGATYDRGRDVLWLLDRAAMRVEPDETGGGVAEGTAGAAGLARADHYVRLTRTAHLVSDGRTIDAEEVTIQLSDDDRLIQTMALRGNSRITGGPGAGGPQAMSARDIDLTYASDGRTLQQARLIENAVAELAGDAASGQRRIAARNIDIGMGADGSTVTALTANGSVQVDIPASAEAPARRINSAALVSGGPDGLQTATFTGGVTFREQRAARAGAPAGERTANAQRLVIETQPGLGAIRQADFHGNVRVVDGTTTAEGPRAVYRVAQDTFDIGPSAGDPGPPPSVNDGRVLVNARTISVSMASKTLSAETDVRSSLHPEKGGTGEGRGGKGAKTEGGRLPSMLKQDQPVNVTANRLEYDGAAALATYTGHARLFQDQTSVQADTIIVDDKNGNLTARGHVTTVMFFEEVDSKTQARSLAQRTATGDVMVYEDARRLATYTTGPTAQAHVVGSEGDVTGDRIELWLKKEANELDHAEADGHVVVKEGMRTARGVHLTYTPADETYVMHGSPVEIEERTPAECRVTAASKVTFRKAAVSTRIENNGVTPVLTRPCVPAS